VVVRLCLAFLIMALGLPLAVILALAFATK